MPTTTRLALPYPALSGAANAPAAIQALAEALDSAALWGQGSSGSRPGSGLRGRFWYSTDIGVLSFDTGTAWVDISPPDASIGPAKIEDTWRLLPAGSVVDWPYGSADVPAGFVLPYGQAISRASFPRLNTLASNAGYPHGNGDGTTTFNLPDYRGRIGVGKDNMGGSVANRVTSAGSGLNGSTLGAAGGLETHTLTVGQIPSHSHTLYNFFGGGVTASGALASVNSAGGSTSTDATGGGGAHPNVQPSIVVNKILAT